MSKFNGALSVSIVLLLGVSHAIIRESVTPNTLGPPHGARTPMHKVEMTQQGYIQVQKKIAIRVATFFFINIL